LPLNGSIKKIISIVNYSTFRRWINDLEDGNLKKKVKLGRSRRTPQDVIDLIIRMAKENLDWGYGRIMGELKKLVLSHTLGINKRKNKHKTCHDRKQA